MWEKILAWVSPTGAKVSRPAPTALQQVPVSADIVTAAGSDVDYSTNPLKAVYVGDPATSGSEVAVKMKDDTAFFVWDCPKGTYIEGIIVGIGSVATGTTALKLIGLR